MANTVGLLRNGGVGFSDSLDALVGGRPSGETERENYQCCCSPKEILLTWPRRQTFVSPAFRHPFQCRQPEVVASVHQALVGLAQMRGVLANAYFISNDTAAIGGLRQKPRMVEGRVGAGRVAILTDPRVGNKLVNLAFDRQSERGPAEYAALAKHGATHYLDSLRVRIPLRPLGRIDDVLPDTFARCMDDECVVCE